MSDSHLFCDNSDNDTLIMTFASFELNMAGIPRFEFYNYLSKNYPQYDHSFFIDKNYCWYNRGLEGLTNNVPETVAYINEHVRAQNYRKIVYMGTSAGGYAAILFASLCEGNNSVVAINPQTDLSIVQARKDSLPKFVVTDWNNLDKDYIDISQYMREDVHYQIGGNLNLSDALHTSKHMTRVFERTNVHKFSDTRSIKGMRDAGVFSTLLNNAIAS